MMQRMNEKQNENFTASQQHLLRSDSNFYRNTTFRVQRPAAPGQRQLSLATRCARARDNAETEKQSSQQCWNKRLINCIFRNFHSTVLTSNPSETLRVPSVIRRVPAGKSSLIKDLFPSVFNRRTVFRLARLSCKI